LLVLTRQVRLVVLKLNLSKEISDRATEICADAVAMRLCKFFTPPALAAAALCVACRERREPVTQRDLAEAAGCEPREVGRCFETILERMHISRPDLNGSSYLQRLAIKNPLPDKVYKAAEETITKSSSAGLNGRNPMTMAAAALYLASCSLGEKITQAEVADAAGVAEESVRECCKAIKVSIPSNPEINSQGQRGAGAPHRVWQA
jgi:transcription initiation factor TFIIB